MCSIEVAQVTWTPAQMQETMLLAERLEDVARAFGDWIWETDAQHRYTWVHGASPGMVPPAVGEPIPAGRVVNWLGEPERPARNLHTVLDRAETIVRLVTEEFHHGELRYVSRRAVALLNADGSLRGYRGCARDVTEGLAAKAELWRRDQALRLAKEQAEASSRARSALVSKLGHELRTPLNAIVGLAQMIQRRKAPSDKASVERWIGQIAETGWHMVDVLDMLTELGRVGAMNASVAAKPVDVDEVLREAVRSVEADAKARLITIAFDNPAPVFAMGDRRALRQVAVNLLSHAIKSNCEGGWVRVSVTEGALTRIDVLDTGPGRSSQGLELLICKELVAAMRGTIQVHSAAGQGTKFSVFLPAVEPVFEASDRRRGAGFSPASPSPA
jgi:signal transduction histidine kinase